MNPDLTTINAAIAASKDREQAATPGPWERNTYQSGTMCVSTPKTTGVRAFYEHHSVLCDCCEKSALHWVCANIDKQQMDNLAFIAHARTFEPKFREALDVAVEALEQLKFNAFTGHNAYQDSCEPCTQNQYEADEALAKIAAILKETTP